MGPLIVLNQNRCAVRAATSRYNAANPRVLSSALHGTYDDGSALDVLPGATLFDLRELQVELESLVGVHVDLLTPGDLPPTFRAQVIAGVLLI